MCCVLCIRDIHSFSLLASASRNSEYLILLYWLLSTIHSSTYVCTASIRRKSKTIMIRKETPHPLLMTTRRLVVTDHMVRHLVDTAQTGAELNTIVFSCNNTVEGLIQQAWEFFFVFRQSGLYCSVLVCFVCTSLPLSISIEAFCAG